MSTTAKVTGYAVALAAAFGIALAVGNQVGPTSQATTADEHAGSHAARTPITTAGPAPRSNADIPGGLMVSQNGYTLDLAQSRATTGRDVTVSFTITGPDGRPVTRYDVEHEKRLHLIAVRRDFAGFQHVHPQLGANGVWSTQLDLAPGPWRVFADFKPTGSNALTLGADLAVPGSYQPATVADTRTARVDGYTVRLDGELRPGADARLRLTVSRDGKPVTDLQPYLGAYGHLVALRDGDLAYLHVHPDGAPGDGATKPGPEVVFYAAVPSTGRYFLYLDFQHQGVVRTAAFAVDAAADPRASAPTATGTPTPSEPGHGGH